MAHTQPSLQNVELIVHLQRTYPLVFAMSRSQRDLIDPGHTDPPESFPDLDCTP